MFSAVCTLKSSSAYSQSKQHFTPKKQKEQPDDYEERTWREKCHYHEDGTVYIPGIQFKNAIAEAAAMLAEKIPGKGNNTWSKHFLAGIMVPEGLRLPFTRDTIPGWKGSMNANGKKGTGSRVLRTFPMVQSWSGAVEFVVVDSLITEELFTRYLQEAGRLVGLGRWRPRVGGENGRFTVQKVVWKPLGADHAAAA